MAPVDYVVPTDLTNEASSDGGLRTLGLSAMYLWASVGTIFIIQLHTGEVTAGSEMIKVSTSLAVAFLVPVWIATAVPLRWLRTGATLQLVVGIVAATAILSSASFFWAAPPVIAGSALWLSRWLARRHDRP